MFTNGTRLWRRGDSTIAHGNRNVTTACPRHCESTEGLLTNQRCSLATGCGIVRLINVGSGNGLVKPLSHSTAIPRRWHGDLKFSEGKFCIWLIFPSKFDIIDYKSAPFRVTEPIFLGILLSAVGSHENTRKIANDFTFSTTWRCHGAPMATVTLPRSAHGVPPRSHGVLTGE